jgi:hypothetical protein
MQVAIRPRRHPQAQQREIELSLLFQMRAPSLSIAIKIGIQ